MCLYFICLFQSFTNYSFIWKILALLVKVKKDLCEIIMTLLATVKFTTYSKVIFTSEIKCIYKMK